jgi:hypothetical protein
MDARSLEVFRPRWYFGVAMAACGGVWLFVLGYLSTFESVPPKTFASVIFFILFFAISVFYYVRTAIFVDADGVTYRGMVRTRRISFEDIKKIDVLPGPIVVYAIRARGGFVHFTNFFRHHQRLMKLVVDRAGLSPTRGL